MRSNLVNNVNTVCLGDDLFAPVQLGTRMYREMGGFEPKHTSTCITVGIESLSVHDLEAQRHRSACPLLQEQYRLGPLRPSDLAITIWHCSCTHRLQRIKASIRFRPTGMLGFSSARNEFQVRPRVQLTAFPKPETRVSLRLGLFVQ